MDGRLLVAYHDSTVRPAFRWWFFAGTLLTCLLLAVSCDNPPTTDPPDEPSREDVINAVRNSVSNKTYPETVRRNCTPSDVNAKFHGCLSLGQTYPVTEYRRCPPLPGPDASWSVQEQGDDKWRVSRAGSVWDIHKESGGGANAGGVTQVSKFSFTITPHQKC